MWLVIITFEEKSQFVSCRFRNIRFDFRKLIDRKPESPKNIFVWDKDNQIAGHGIEPKIPEIFFGRNSLKKSQFSLFAGQHVNQYPVEAKKWNVRKLLGIITTDRLKQPCGTSWPIIMPNQTNLLNCSILFSAVLTFTE